MLLKKKVIVRGLYTMMRVDDYKTCSGCVTKKCYICTDFIHHIKHPASLHYRPEQE